MLEARGLVNLGRLSGEDVGFSSWWIRLSTKIAVYRITNLVTDMSIDVKRKMKPNALGMTFPLLSFS